MYREMSMRLRLQKAESLLKVFGCWGSLADGDAARQPLLRHRGLRAFAVCLGGYAPTLHVHDD